MMFHKDGSIPAGDMIFVFGSNLAGVHGAGAARAAMEDFGAIYGIGVGFVGQSYAIPTKDYQIQTMKLEAIKPFIEQFVHVTHTQHTKKFFITRVGCGLAGFTDDQIAPLFAMANHQNCSFPEPWKQYIHQSVLSLDTLTTSGIQS
jgi:hypothetical protein